MPSELSGRYFESRSAAPAVNPPVTNYLDIHTELVQYGGPYPHRLCTMCFVETKLR